MNQNNKGHNPQPNNDPQRVTTEKGARNQTSIPGISGRWVAWGLGGFMAFSLITIPAGLFVYQGVSDREKEIEKAWPAVAASLDSFYTTCDQLLDTQHETPELTELHSRWTAAHKDFRSRRIWHEQLVAAQNLEDLLKTPVAGTEGKQFIDLLAASAATPEQREALQNARSNSTTSYRTLESEQLAPYKTKLANFPGSAVLLFFVLPDPPLLDLPAGNPIPSNATDPPVTK